MARWMGQISIWPVLDDDDGSREQQNKEAPYVENDLVIEADHVD